MTVLNLIFHVIHLPMRLAEVNTTHGGSRASACGHRYKASRDSCTLHSRSFARLLVGCRVTFRRFAIFICCFTVSRLLYINLYPVSKCGVLTHTHTRLIALPAKSLGLFS